jgi:hypothetical protein
MGPLIDIQPGPVSQKDAAAVSIGQMRQIFFRDIQQPVGEVSPVYDSVAQNTRNRILGFKPKHAVCHDRSHCCRRPTGSWARNNYQD